MIGAQLRKHHRSLIVQLLIALFAQTHRHRSNQRFFRQRVVRLEIRAECRRTNEQHAVVHRTAEYFCCRACFSERQRRGREISLRRNVHVKRRARRKIKRHFAIRHRLLEHWRCSLRHRPGKARERLGNLCVLRERIGERRPNHFTDFHAGFWWRGARNSGRHFARCRRQIEN